MKIYVKEWNEWILSIQKKPQKKTKYTFTPKQVFGKKWPPGKPSTLIFKAIVAGFRGFSLPKKHRTQRAFQADCFWGSSLKGLLNLKSVSRIQPWALWGISGKTQIPKFFLAVFGCYMFKPGTYPVKNNVFWWMESSIGRWFQIFAWDFLLFKQTSI